MIFLDSGYFKGLMNQKDAHHKDSLKIQEYINKSNETTVINTTVLVETLNQSIKTNIFANKIYNVLQSQNQII